MNTLQRIGVVLLVVGLLLILLGRMPFLGRLPGDIEIKRGSWSFYLPLATCLLFSVVLSLLWTLVVWCLRRRG